MKQYGFVYSNLHEMKSFIYSMNIDKKDSILIQVFTGVVEIEFINNIIDEIVSVLPQAEIIGTTTAGEIYTENVFTNTTTISFTIFEKVQIKAKLLNNNNNEYKLGIKIVEELVAEDTKVIILFSDGLLTNGYDIIKGIQSANSNIIVCGGKAGDNGYLKETFVFTKKGITKNGIAAVSLTGKYLNVTTESSFGWSTIGKLMTITKASDNKIFTIDNVKAVDIYKKYLGDEVAKGLPMSATEFPLIHIKNGIHIARVAFGCYDDGSLSFSGNVEVGDKVQFGYGNVNMLTEQSLEISNRLKNKNVEAIFVYSCSVRRAFMQDKINLEIYPLNNIAPTFGFFTYGEFFTCNHSNELLSVTMTILGISEGEQTFKKNELAITKNESPSKSFFEGKDLGVIKVFTNLVNQTTKELQQANEVLQEQKCKIEQINNITKSIMEINSEMLSSGEIDSLLQMILDKALDIIPNGKIGSILFMENDKLCYKATKGYLSDEIKKIEYKIEDTYQHRTYDIDELYNPIIISDVEKYLSCGEYDYDSWKSMLGRPPRELLTCGIGIDGKFMGVINIFNTDNEGNFNEEDKNLLKYLCYDIEIALRNAQLLENILYMSRYDSLTGLYNRRYFREILNKTLNKVKISDETFVICILDLNNLKIINDTYGHDAGDVVLRKFTSIFKGEIGKNDVFGRTGGDEFTVIFINKNKTQVIDIMSKICTAIKNYFFDFNGDTKVISFAYGISEFNCDSDDVDELLKIADKRMYEKKRIMKENQK
jgi:diguanylate cyclase (GGDEF) domain